MNDTFSLWTTALMLMVSILMLCQSWLIYSQAKKFRKDMEEIRDKIEHLTPTIDWTNRELWTNEGKVEPLAYPEQDYKK